MTTPANSDAVAVAARSTQILLIAHDRTQADATLGVLREGKIRNALTVICIGRQDPDFLARERAEAAKSRPDVIIVEHDARTEQVEALLAIIDAEPALASVPTIVVSVDSVGSATLRARRAAATAYLRKPFDAVQFIGAIESVADVSLVIARTDGHHDNISGRA